MSAGKIGCLVLYAVLILVAIVQAGTPIGMGAGGILLALAVSHLLEMVLYYRLCKQSSGGLAGKPPECFRLRLLPHDRDESAAANPLTRLSSEN